jgi:hypothetical protein
MQNGNLDAISRAVLTPTLSVPIVLENVNNRRADVGSGIPNLRNSRAKVWNKVRARRGTGQSGDQVHDLVNLPIVLTPR